MDDSSILITGGSGFIGSHLVAELLRGGCHRVVNLDALTYAATSDTATPASTSENYHFVHADICDSAAVDAILRKYSVTTVFHLAAESHVDRSIDGPAAFLKTNTLGTQTLLESCRRHWATLPPEDRQRFRFVNVSTDEVYGSVPAGSLSETAPYRPSSPYAASKAAADHIVAAYHQTYGLPSITLHAANTYGPRQFPEKLIPLMIVNAVQELPLPIYGNGLQVRSWLSVHDHVNGILAAWQHGTEGQTYNLGSETLETNLNVVQAICDAVDASLPDRAPRQELIQHVPDRPGHDQRYSICSEKANRELGWSPKQDWRLGLAATARWYLDNQAWVARVQSRSEYRGQRLGASERR